MSAGRSGVARAAMYIRFHLTAPKTGNVDSDIAVCIAWVARMAGATNAR